MDAERMVTAVADALEAVQRLHSKREFNGDGYGWANCAECRQHYPCETIKVIQSATQIDGDA